ncbi:MAG: DUF58 domain-containing protein [Burkholderiales bacterium]
MLIPSRPFLWILAALLAVGIAAAFVPEIKLAWAFAATVLAVGALGDGLYAVSAPRLSARRVVPGSLALGVWHPVRLRLANGERRALTLVLYDHHPAPFETRGLPRAVRLPAGGWSEIEYEVRPVQRGEFRFGAVEVRVRSPLALWVRAADTGEASLTRVYPNFAAITKYALLATDNRLSQIGILQRRRRGEGLDFHQLREWREGDSLRSVDWKATSRTMKLVSREYQDERDQQIVFLIDCGRRLAAQDDDLSHFDHVLNSALLLSYVALRQGDAVGFMTFGGVERFMAPRKSAATVSLMLNQLYDLQPTLASSDYTAAALALTLRVRKRALVVVLSNLRDEDDDTLAPALALLSQRHLVMFASLREHLLTRALDVRVDSFDRALTHASAAQYLRAREVAFRRLGQRGATCLDVEPQQLAVALVNRYQDLKRAGRL